MTGDAPATRGEASAALAVTIEHHERTKHRPHRYARSPGRMDWATEPDPFRRYGGARLLALDEAGLDEGPRYGDLFVPGRVPACAPDRDAVSRLFYDSLAVSAWKEFRGARWSLRVNPSSGDLHPTEGYLVCDAVPGVCELPAVLHYCPLVHGLEQRASIPLRDWRLLCSGLPPHAQLVGLTSICWREAWKYGERAFRYCQLDLGHAIAAMTFAAASLGWDARLLGAATCEDIATLLGIAGQRGPEAERAGCLLAVWPGPAGPRDESLLLRYRPDQAALRELARTTWSGRPNRLSPDHVRWPTLDAVAEATRKSDADGPARGSPDAPAAITPRPARRAAASRDIAARRIFRTRRSAVDLDGHTSIARPVFYSMLERTLPGGLPFGALPWPPAVHVLLFVHRVEGLPRGLYLLARDVERADDLRGAITRPFEWRRPAGCPQTLPLWLLRAGDFRDIALLSSCHQEIASDGAFAAAFLCEFEPRLAACGPWFYRRLHWEAGAIGQVLYLEAEAAGVRATGMGCFFDDLTHELLGLQGRRYQTLYHFTVGGPVEDERLTTLPAYPPPS
jgi:SagB-type dehydrogenase family enzyme